MQLHSNGTSHIGVLAQGDLASWDSVILPSHYAEIACRFADQHLVTIAAGATCAYLGDERNLREFLVADETARQLQEAGHTVTSFLIDDSMEALNFRQLRVAVDKNPQLIERYRHWCGRPIGHLPDPFGCHTSFAGHFEEELLRRLHRLGCHPVMVSTAKLYAKGAYTPYINIVLERYEEILAFLSEHFAGYEPEKLFYPLCPHCHHLPETEIESIKNRHLTFHCRHCDTSSVIPFEEVRGKLNWKLDCAARWVIFKVDAEPFNKSYLEPQTGTFAVAQALSREFFGGHEVFPLHYGTVKMENKYSYQLLESLPGTVLRTMLVESPSADIKISRELIVTIASRHEVMPALSYLDFIKQLLPMWMLTPHSLTSDQRDLVAQGLAFRQHFLHDEAHQHLPERHHFRMQTPEVLATLRVLLLKVIQLREAEYHSDQQLREDIKQAVNSIKEHRKPAVQWMRMVIGQQQGLPASRFLQVLPLDYLKMLEYMLEVHLYLHNLNLPDDETADTTDIGSVAAPLTEPIIERRALAKP